MEEITLVMGKDGKFKEYNPYAEIVVDTEEDYKEFQKSLGIAATVKELFETGGTINFASGKVASSYEELIAPDLDNENKPCPFCGGEVVINRAHSNGEDGFIAECSECTVSLKPTTPFVNSEDALAAWNLRDKRNNRA